MLTNQDRRAILEQVKTSGSGDIMAALQGQPILPQQEEQQIPTPQPVELPPTSPPPVQNVSMDSIPSTANSLVDSSSNTSLQIQDLPTGSPEPQLLKTGGLKKYSPGGLYTAEASSTAVAPVNIPTVIESKTQEEKIQEIIANSLNKPQQTVYDPLIGNNPNKQWISGASNKMYANAQQKQKSQEYGETVLGFAAPIPFLNSMKVSASGAKIPGLIDDVILGPLGKAYGKAKDLFKKNPLSTDMSKARIPKYDDMSLIHNMSFEDMAKPESLNPGTFSKLDTEKLFNAKLSHIKYLQSDEYASKRMANTGESLSAVKAQVDDYIKEINEAPINMEFFDNEISRMRMKGAWGQYYGAPPGKVGRIYVKRGYGENLSDETWDVLKHEIGHAGSPAGKMKIANPDAPLGNQYEEFIGPKIYKNYPTLKIKKEITGNYMRDPAEQQVRLVRSAEWLKQNVKWDGNPNTLTDDMISTLINKVSKSEVPHDIEMLIRYADATPKQMKDAIGKAWALAPVAVGAGAATSENKKETVSFKDGGWSTFGKTGKFLKEDAFSKDNIMSVLNLNVKKDLEEGTPTVLYGYTNDQMTMNDLERMKQYIKTKGLNVKQYFDAYIRGDEFKRKEIENYRKKNPDTRIDRSLMRLLGRSALMLSPLEVGVGSTLIDPDTGVHKITGEKFDMKFEEGGLRDHMMSYMDFRGSDTTNVNLVMNAISQHESGNVDDKIQVSQKDDGTFYDGPGRGAYQFEIGDEKGANTAMNRTANFLASPANKTYFGSNKSMKDFPNLYNKYIASPSQDFSKLSRKDQDALFLGDKIYGGVERRDAFDKAINNPTQENVFMYWLKNHKGKVNGKSVSELTEKEINVERKKWNERTKNMFKLGGKPFEYGGFKKKCKYGCW